MYPALIISPNLHQYLPGLQAGTVVHQVGPGNLAKVWKQYQGLPLDRPLTLYDFRDFQDDSLLTNMLDNFGSDIIVLSSTDCIGDRLLSRFITVHKDSECNQVSKEEGEGFAIRRLILSSDLPVKVKILRFFGIEEGSQ